MKFAISRENLLEPLQLICTIVEKKQTLPILSNVLFKIKGKTLTLTGTDLELELITKAKLIESEKEGSITVPARKLLDITRNLPANCTCQFTISDKGHLTLSTDSSRFTLSTQPANEYPTINIGAVNTQITLFENDFKLLLEKTCFAMAQQDVRYYLNGLLLEISGNKVTTVATDGHRLAVSSKELNYDSKQNMNLIIPRKGVLELIKLLKNNEDEIKAEIGSNFIRFNFGNVVFTSILIEGKFPDYKMVIPKNGDKTVIAQRASLKSALSRAAILSHDKHHGIRTEINSTMQKIFATNAENEESEESLPIEFIGSNGLEIGLNVNYLQDVLSVLTDEQVKMIFSDSNSSILVQAGNSEDESLYVIMPMRL